MSSNIVEMVEVRVGHYAGRICTAWQKSIAGFVEAGRLLIEAKRELPGGFIAMVEADLPFSRSTAHRLMQIAEHPVIGDVAHAQHLPASWMTLYELTKLPADELRARIADGTINPKLERRAVAAMLNKPTNNSDEVATVVRNGRSDNGQRLAVPEGKTLADLCRDAAQLQADGASFEDAAKQAGLSIRSYREGWTVVQLSERNDLGESDAVLAREALANMNAMRRTHRPFLAVKELAARVWGAKAQRNDNSSRQRVEAFRHAINYVAETCAHTGSVAVPVMGDEDTTAVLTQLREATAALRRFAARIERSKS